MKTVKKILNSTMNLNTVGYALLAGAGIGFYGLRKYIKGSNCYLNNRIDDKVVLITGSNTGIGLETALELAKRGAYIHLACRNEENCRNAKDRIVQLSGVGEARIFCHKLDLASFRSILDFVKKFKSQVKKLDILINNAGVMMCPYGLTEDGFETQMGVNHLGHFLLTNQLIDLLKVNGGGRIINVSSLAHEMGSLKDLVLNLKETEYSSVKAYSKSKLANVLHARYLSAYYGENGITAVALHPGAVNTELQRHLPWIVKKMFCHLFMMFIKTPKEGAQTSIYCALLPNLEEYSGQYFSDCAVKISTNKEAHDDELMEKVWTISSKLVEEKLELISK